VMERRREWLRDNVHRGLGDEVWGWDAVRMAERQGMKRETFKIKGRR
jgi:hypothetical protein